MGRSNKQKNETKRSLLSKDLNETTVSLNTVGKIHLSLLNSGLLPVTDEAKFISLIPKTPIELSKFSKHLELLRKYDMLLRAEFQLATKGESHSTRHGSKPANEGKNSFKKLVPYDYNRVVLKSLPDIPNSDYINASYIDSMLKPNAYIATQGPNETTVADFWRMVWEQNTYVIVMLTKVFDFIRVMCVQYWPSELDHPESYGDIELTLLSEENLSNFVIRTVRIKKNGNEREVTQLHFTNWPSHTVPFPSALLEFRRRVRVYMDEHPDVGPPIVHCSDGCGRTGTYLVIDTSMELMKEDGVVDVFNCTKQIRCARKGVVETLEQYKFIYEALEDTYLSGVTWFSINELSHKLKHKSRKHSTTQQNEYQKEYQKICKMVSKMSIGDCAGGHRPENRDKNRDVAIVPPDDFRPYLTSFQSNDSTDYINAVFVDGYTRSKEYIVAEWPLQKTVADLWSLVYDHDCNSVVVLCNPTPSNIVSLTELMAGVRTEPKTTQLFQITCWPNGYKVPTSTNALVELMNMVERWRQRSSYGPVVVISANGRNRSGVYCAANVVIEQVVQHGEIDVFQAVKTVRRHRPQLVENMTEYKYCYDLVWHYILHYLHKE
ncbi:receptor-type tyrosine-protein phosphatase kappa-like isoform X2 [Tachypleus tridentatus]|uniref:receptor-type tyrosine-protein phosphatase kappa-like isoform X2 n=1 Tax=Tachypleus tridentatus TaxID=6853 RepID=UPI003FCF8EC8